MRITAALALASMICACGTAASETSFDDTTGGTLDLGADLPTEQGDCDRLEQLVAVLEADPANADAQLDTFVRTVSYGPRGFPIVEGQRLCAVYRGEPASSVAIVGEFNDWTADAHPLTQLSATFAYALIELDAPPSGLYKYVLDGQFVADPLARRFGWDEFGEYSQFDALPDSSHHERWPAFDEAIGGLEPRTITVWLPAGAFDGPPLPSLYMHDGQNLFDPDALWGGWQIGPTLDDAIGSALIEPLIVIGVDNTAARMDEYTPVEDLIDGVTLGGRADEYAAFLVDGAKPFIESRYPVTAAPDSTALMGSSLGGLVSLYVGLRYPGQFASVASMSGTVTWGTIGASNPTIIDAYVDAPPLGLRIYLDSGGDAGPGCPGGGSDNYCGNVELAETLRGLGWVDEVDLFYRWDPSASHNEAAWATRLLPALIDWL